jgi:carboxypeptidase PM20D1
MITILMGAVGYVLISIGALFLALILVIVIRALTFKDPNDYKKQVPFDAEKDDVVYKLGELIKIKTISHENRDEIDFSYFEEYIEKTKELYPTVFSKCEWEITKEYAFKIKLKGLSSEKPTVLMAHYDVVPVTEGWDHDPFLGEVVDGYLYGRGTLDTKNTMACALCALEKALENGYVPKNDLYLCFGSNEEVYGDSQVKIVEEFKQLGIKPG